METWSAARDVLAKQTVVGFDLEGDFNLHRYGRRVCLFQLALADGTAILLDPLEHSFRGESDWAEFRTFLEDPAITKVIWAAQNDVRALKFCHAIALAGLFDLFDAARLTGFAKPSLPLLIERHLEVQVVKDEQWQISDWNRRPLSESQLAYAALDVRYLIPLADKLRPVLEEKRQVKAFEARMRSVEAYVFEESPQPWLKVKGAGALLPKQALRLQGLWTAREEEARRRDVAPWRVLSNEALLGAARQSESAASEA